MLFRLTNHTKMYVSKTLPLIEHKSEPKTHTK